MDLLTILTIIYYIIAAIVFILFRRNKIIITFNEKDVTRKLDKYIIVIQIIASVAWPLSVILATINSIKGK